jgi:hypothetical protein
MIVVWNSHLIQCQALRIKGSRSTHMFVLRGEYGHEKVERCFRSPGGANLCQPTMIVWESPPVGVAII